ncbi:hypothetical protein QR680_002052 [Steinernema hermaphroditum]|uniref:Homeobox domain-containing protein n=1 Tax=Steinernema hermaphroditum TaxID=289476 RepID=A0AA39H2R8_9BILA|nr:hypothetical protein QR680_002052 [Steinernema hermaphroditum]
MSRDDRFAFSISHLLQPNSSTTSTVSKVSEAAVKRKVASDSATTADHSSAEAFHVFEAQSSSAPALNYCNSDSSPPLAETAESSSSRTSPELSEPMEMNHPFSSPQWYNAVNYVSMATQQISQHLASSAAAQQSLIPGGWDPRIPWIYPYIHKTQQKRKGGQIRFTNEQTDALEQKFDNHKYLSPQERKKLAKSLQLSERQVIHSFVLEASDNIRVSGNMCAEGI